MAHEIGVPRLPEPPKEWSPRWMQDHIRVVSQWMVRMTSETNEESGTVSVQEVTTDSLVGPSDGTILVDTTAGEVIILLPDPTTVVGREFTVKKISTDVNRVKIGATAGTLEQAHNAFLLAPYSSTTWKSDGTDYWLIAQIIGNSMMIAPAAGSLVTAGVAPSLRHITPGTGTLTITGVVATTR